MMKAKSYQPDFVIVFDKQAPRDQRMKALVETVPFQHEAFNKIEPEITVGSKEEYMQELILRNAKFTSKLPSTASQEEKKAEREKVLNAKNTRWRFSFHRWPRDPNGKPLTNENSRLGKMADKGRELIWGATLADICYTDRLVKNSPYKIMTITSASKMYNWCKAHTEEYSKAIPFMQAAENEDDPQVVSVCGSEEFILLHEHMIIKGVGAPRIINEKEKGGYEYGEVPAKSPFNFPGHSQPWRLPIWMGDWLGQAPEGEDAWVIDANQPSCTLQDYIPQHLLPKKLAVHDPWKLLYAVSSQNHKCTRLQAKNDIVHIYKLELSTQNTERRTQDEKEYIDKVANVNSVRATFLANPHSSQELPEGMIYTPRLFQTFAKNKPGPFRPAVYIVFPPKPPRAPADMAHLYLSPSETIGEGHHSFVYRAELEVPRSLLVGEEICIECVRDDVERILLEEDGPDGNRRDPKWDELSGKYSLKKVGKPGRWLPLDDGVFYEWQSSTIHNEVVYEGPYRAIATKIGYQNLERAPYCEHFQRNKMHQVTAKTIVAAKLSIQHDDHLGNEAENYQAFPKNFFEHYNGYNIIMPLSFPTPVGALVPQFYGYYVLDEDVPSNQKGATCLSRPQYLSPILLIEECGKPIVPQKLTLDDRDECASLVYRLHHAGWVHNSLYQRNIVRQPGPLHARPYLREFNAVLGRGGLGKHWSFRLIDFGRTIYTSNVEDREWVECIKYEDQKLEDWIFGKKPIEP